MDALRRFKAGWLYFWARPTFDFAWNAGFYASVAVFLVLAEIAAYLFTAIVRAHG